jgi:hypothetical protein
VANLFNNGFTTTVHSMNLPYYWIERYQDCLDACQRLLREGKMPSDMYDRVKRNADFATTKLRPA